MTEVQRARVRALASRLMTMDPQGFNLLEPCHCSLHVAAGMAEFQAAFGAHLSPSGLPKIGNTHMDNLAEEIFGLSRRYFAYPPKNLPTPCDGWYAGMTHDPFRVGIAYLAAIGDVGPPDLRARQQLGVHSAVECLGSLDA